MARNVKRQHVQEMYEAVLKLQTVEECRQFFTDLCSPSELSAMEQRYAVAELLMRDTVYLDILEKTNASTATISRVNRMLRDGTGVLPRILEEMQADREKKPE